mmetsp:Transcript_13639/g.29559  ORF Transcript_13639/g.29559 Transcript_13639/m.29559 type:complete len:423 (+) Transcript_13639:87-1355(+)|eukprot:CAMPEP_0172538386 /NCGR_PEP_ID=MMETSP1067-20121228/9776_1 /TAXON_ID=265564 ORGANISM="Thalassiosira punctigera, Strain Tpunct2005C2" /NCGR_SAMPLE_ID=MMETSP1067 /ASSEMBLY_ACC=CAM_ASM_000444 /LENGTH=422 /DNA_ID=CAMNT_0013323869 /DNA_START=60 /DNA_END=1328 /DNA_ORIENTATION=+
MTLSPLAPTTALLLSSLSSSPLPLLAFAPRCRPLHSNFQPSTSSLLAAARSKTKSKSPFSPSTVVDPDGPTPVLEPDPFPEIDLDSLPEAHYDEENHPIPHQPWRRGDTDGCHDPINAPWRLKAESIISDAVTLVGCKVVDVTWYMAKCVISLDEESFKNAVAYVDGPEVRVEYPDETDISGHIYEDPEAGTEDEMFTEEDELLDYEQYDEDTEEEILRANMPAEYDESTGEELPPREPRSREERVMEMEEEWESRWLDEPRTEKPSDGMFSHPVDTKALSVVSQAITQALSEERVEEELKIQSRHDIILTSPLGNPCILDSQKEFDAARDLDVYVETRDPWGSNRVLGGKLVDRNAMDVIINQDNSGRMVTIPNSMIHQVLLPSGLAKGSAKIKSNMEEDEGEEGGDGGGYLEVEEEEVFE